MTTATKMARFVNAAPTDDEHEWSSTFVDRAAALNKEAEAAGTKHIYRVIAHLVKTHGDDLTAAQVAGAMAEQLGMGSEDDESGRCNDVRRAFNDGVRKGVNFVMGSIFTELMES